MREKRMAAEASPKRLSPIRVVVELSKLPKWCELTRREGFEVSQCSGTPAEMLAECRRIAPCVLAVSQESLEKVDAEEFSASVGVESSVRVLVLSTRKSPNLVENFLSMGCMGCLPQDVSGPTLRRAVRAIASGQLWADRKTIARVMKSLILKKSLQKLTSRETDILRLIVSGLCNRAIADRLCITHETVRWHIREMYSKLRVQDRFSAIVYGKRLLDSEGAAMPSENPDMLTPQSSGDVPQKRAGLKAGPENQAKFLQILLGPMFIGFRAFADCLEGSLDGILCFMTAATEFEWMSFLIS